MGKLKEVLALLARPLLFLLYFASGYMPRSKQRWVMGSWGGLRFADNGAALFEYCATLPQGTAQVTWITARSSILKDLRTRGLRAHYAWSLPGIYHCLRAGVFIFDGYTKDINHWLSRGAYLVLLRHGVGIKKIERAIDLPGHRLFQLFHGNVWQRLMWRISIPWHDTPLSLVLASSEDHARQGELFFAVPKEKIAITGFARNDILFASDWRDHCNPQQLCWVRQRQNLGEKVFLYMPTFRDSGASSFPFDWQAFDAALQERKLAVVVRLHSADRAWQELGKQVGLQQIKLDNGSASPYPLFHAVEGLISDYSSVAYDFMLLHKPVVFFCHDLEQYTSDSRSLYFNYSEVSPGPRPRTLEELLDVLEPGGTAAADSLHPDYHQVLGRLHHWQDGESSRRSYEAITTRLAERQASGDFASESND